MFWAAAADSSVNNEIWGSIKNWNSQFSNQIADTPSSSYEVVKFTKGNEKASKSTCSSWWKQFKNGENMIVDRKGRGRKRRIVRTVVRSVTKLVLEDRFAGRPSCIISASGLHTSILTKQFYNFNQYSIHQDICVFIMNKCRLYLYYMYIPDLFDNMLAVADLPKIINCQLIKYFSLLLRIIFLKIRPWCF
jgi:hypothetical protein